VTPVTFSDARRSCFWRKKLLQRQEVPVEVLTQSSVAAKFALLISASPMILGIAFAVRPNERWLALMRPLSLAGIFAAISNVFLGLANTLHWLATHNTFDASNLGRAAAGLSESTVLPFASFAFLTVAWLSVAIGMRRQSLG
jgi:hypothetical protein